MKNRSQKTEVRNQNFWRKKKGEGRKDLITNYELRITNEGTDNGQPITDNEKSITNYELRITNENLSEFSEKNLSGTLCDLSGTLCNDTIDEKKAEIRNQNLITNYELRITNEGTDNGQPITDNEKSITNYELRITNDGQKNYRNLNKLKTLNSKLSTQKGYNQAKKIKKFFSRFPVYIFFLLSFTFFACNKSDKDPKASGIYESVNSGTITCLVDEAVWDFMQPVFNMYDSAYKEIHPTFLKVTSREAMAQLLAGNVKVIVTPRDYLKDEDSLMKAFKVEPHERAIYAIDGLVFYVNKDFPLDSISDSQIKEILSKPDKKLKDYFPHLKKEPVFVCNDYTSSEYANLQKIVLKGTPSKNKIIFQKNSELVKKYVRENPDAIGIGYLSQIVKDADLKGLMISFVDSSGKYIFPHVVHQANILRKYYPYIVNHYVYILKKQRDRAFWFAMFLEREFVVQSYFNNSGIVPAYAKIKLIEE
ncbi:MAG: substrate-binding domain-containing protein [bacterium]